LVLVGLLVVLALFIIWQECQITKELYQASRLTSVKSLLQEENLALSLRVKEHKSLKRLTAQAGDMALVPYFNLPEESETFFARAGE
jgi:hypothetical protein